MFLTRGKQTTVVMWCFELFKNNPELQKVGTNLLSSTSRRYSVNQLRYLSVQTLTDSSCTLWPHVKYTCIISVNKFFIFQLYFWRVFF
jgi:hypothetical protein